MGERREKNKKMSACLLQARESQPAQLLTPHYFAFEEFQENRIGGPVAVVPAKTNMFPNKENKKKTIW